MLQHPTVLQTGRRQWLRWCLCPLPAAAHAGLRPCKAASDAAPCRDDPIVITYTRRAGHASLSAIVAAALWNRPLECLVLCRLTFLVQWPSNRPAKQCAS
jgi:hypothetical protein